MIARLCPASSVTPSHLPGKVFRGDPRMPAMTDSMNFQAGESESPVTRYCYGVAADVTTCLIGTVHIGESFAKFLVAFQKIVLINIKAPSAQQTVTSLILNMSCHSLD
jgi:hypothetical protein